MYYIMTCFVFKNLKKVFCFSAIVLSLVISNSAYSDDNVIQNNKNSKKKLSNGVKKTNSIVTVSKGSNDGSKSKDVSKVKNYNDNFLKKFAKKYIFADENQVFGKNKHGVFVSYGVSVNEDRRGTLFTPFAPDVVPIPSDYEYDDGYIDYDPETGKYSFYEWNGKHRYRAVGAFSIHYSTPIKLMNINGRLSMGLMSWHGLNNTYSKRFGALGVEFIPEFIFGNKFLYVTAGVGPSYVIPFSHYNKHTNMGSQFFFAIVANIGHRFDNGLVTEIGWKHYSNGELRVPNVGLNLVNFTIGYTF